MVLFAVYVRCDNRTRLWHLFCFLYYGLCVNRTRLWHLFYFLYVFNMVYVRWCDLPFGICRCHNRPWHASCIQAGLARFLLVRYPGRHIVYTIYTNAKLLPWEALNLFFKIVAQLRFSCIMTHMEGRLRNHRFFDLSGDCYDHDHKNRLYRRTNC